MHRSLTLQANTLAPAARIAVLDDALAVAEIAGDRRRRILSLAALAEAEWERGERGLAFAALDRVAETDGPDAAIAACPVELRDEYHPEYD